MKCRAVAFANRHTVVHYSNCFCEFACKEYSNAQIRHPLMGSTVTTALQICGGAPGNIVVEWVSPPPGKACADDKADTADKADVASSDQTTSAAPPRRLRPTKNALAAWTTLADVVQWLDSAFPVQLSGMPVFVFLDGRFTNVGADTAVSSVLFATRDTNVLRLRIGGDATSSEFALYWR